MNQTPRDVFLRGLLKSIGPGILLAGAAIGVSHLVQATRAGAEFRFGMIGLLILACATKYPFLEFGPRYAAATGETLIDGYRKLGAWALWLCAIVTVGSMFIIMAALTIVTATLAEYLLQPYLPFGMTPLMWSSVIVIACLLMLVLGRYPLLDSTMKLVMVILLFSTIAALVMAITSPSPHVYAVQPPQWWAIGTFGFLLAFMGWMPIPIDSAIWHSIWIQERRKQTNHLATMGQVRFDFNFGYILAGLVAIMFLLLGALVMFGAPETFAAGGAGFATQFIELYGNTLGAWSIPIIAIAALTTMFSTTLVVLDAFPRVMQRLTATILVESPSHKQSSTTYAMWVLAQAVLALVILAFLGGQLTRMVDLATTLSFLTAPILACINYRVVTSQHMPIAHRPGTAMRVFSVVSIVVLSMFSVAYLLWRILG